MVGVESLHLFQSVFLLHCCALEYTGAYSQFRHFAPLTANLQFLSQTSNILLPHDRIPFSALSSGSSLMFLVLLLVACLCLVLAAQRLGSAHPVFSSIPSAVYQSAVFSVSMGFLPTLLLMVPSMRSAVVFWPNNRVFSALALVGSVICGAVFFNEWKQLFTDACRKKPSLMKIGAKRGYVPVYLSCQLLQITLIAATLNNFKYTL